MQFDLSRDFLDGLAVQPPRITPGQDTQIRAAGQLHFLPSSADGTMHTAIVSFALFVGNNEQPFAQGGWRFLFTSDEQADPKQHQQHPFMAQMLVSGTGKLMVQFNNLLMHAGLSIIPLDPTQLVVRANSAPPGVPLGAVPAPPRQGASKTGAPASGSSPPPTA
ncbi:MAG: hypothetical protein N3B15_07400 [Planctomycetota bacterium]|nr:hypothetical protein [Planctomycetota bacterium]